MLRKLTEHLHCSSRPARRYEALASAAHRAARVARRSLLQHGADDPCAALRLCVGLCGGDAHGVQGISQAVPRLLRCRGDDGVWDGGAVLRMHRLRLDETACHVHCRPGRGLDARAPQNVGTRTAPAAARHSPSS